MSKTLYRRQFLNTEEHGGTAFLEAEVNEIETAHNGEKHFDATFTLADCNRKVEISFSVWGEDDAANARQKLLKFRRAVLAFEAQVLAQLDEVEGRK